MRNFLFSIFLLGILSSCSSYKADFIPVQKNRETFTPDFLTEKNLEKVFKVDIEVYGHQLGGIMAVKKLAPEHYRIALLTEIGAKLLDFELNKEEMKLNYAIEQLNRKIILNILKQDFLILLNENIDVEEQYRYNDYTIYQASISGKKLYYFIIHDTLQLDKTVWASGQKEKTVFTYFYSDTDFPDIKIDHKNVKLTIELRVLENEE